MRLGRTRRADRGERREEERADRGEHGRRQRDQRERRELDGVALTAGRTERAELRVVIRAGAQRAAERLRREQDAHEAEQERQDPQPVDQWIVRPIDARELLRRQRDRQVDRRVDPAGLRHRVAERREVGGSAPQPHRVGQVEDAVREGTGERGRQVDAGFALSASTGGASRGTR